ncbi:hypothetical protein [Niabella hibiscisoli]|uniref:hypothetical protein n=1 Tax=Niabella hibiscisoli TaxID=1825928 RepID=UPI001F107B1B|nr:hypothetical protein [Niabella hibiscisoli]MCH5717201.1 hypothetical protein [Niabella hibiscisoli]
MVLSRIWSAFIIIALAVAVGRFVFQDDQKQIFTQMVTGKSGDTTFVQTVDSLLLPASVHSQITAGLNGVKWEGHQVIPAGNGQFKIFKLQSTNGVFETTKDAVTLCIGLIGIMALFLGFMNIAEQAGGVRFLSRIIGPFFQRSFPKCPRITPPWDIW